MLHLIAVLSGVVLAGYVVWMTVVSGGEYRALKEAIANGDLRARSRYYVRIIVFEWVSALLAFVALEFDRLNFTAAPLALGETPIFRWLLSQRGELNSGFLVGAGVGMTIGLVAISIVAIRARRRGATQRQAAPWWRKVMPDFTALIPSTARERLIFVVVAISAGVCEEVVFRAWLLSTLHRIGLTGTGLVLVAAGLFGVAHAYQGVAGVLSTALAGFILCALYIMTGTLLAPIVLHTLIDLRMVAVPSSLPQLRPAEHA